jgi:hypothetical protein
METELMQALIAEVRGLRADMRALTGAMLTREQAASYLGISLSQFEKYSADDDNRAILKPRNWGRKVVYYADDLDRFRSEKLGGESADAKAKRLVSETVR